MDLLPIYTYWIFRTLFYALYGIFIFRFGNSVIRLWIKDGGLIKVDKDVKFRMATQVLITILYLVGVIFYCALISYFFSFFNVNGNFLNLTIVTCIIVIPMFFWEIIKANSQEKK
jgi:hypothetical protein